MALTIVIIALEVDSRSAQLAETTSADRAPQTPGDTG